MEPQKHLEDFGEQAPTINKMQSEGLSGFLSLYKVLLRSDLFLKYQLFFREMGAFFVFTDSCDCGPNCLKTGSVSAGTSAFVLNL